MNDKAVEECTKALCVIQSCRTQLQLDVCERYVSLYVRRYPEYGGIHTMLNRFIKKQRNKVKPKKFSYWYS